MAYAKGCRPDTDERRARYANAEEHPKLAAHLGKGPLPAFSLQAHEPPRLDQGQSGSCTAGSSTAATFCAFSVAGKPLTKVPSQRMMYSCTRAIERAATHKTGALPKLADGGAMPGDVITAAATWGIEPMTGPTPDGRNYDIWTDADAPNGNVNDEPELLDVEAGASRLIAGQYRINPKAANVGDQVAAAIASGFPVLVGFFCDSTFEAWKKGHAPLGAPDTTDPTGGGHAVWLSAYSTDAQWKRSYRLVNSWGHNWADDGTCLVNEAWLSATWDLIVWEVSAK